MSREATRMYPQDNFDHDAHIADFLHTSAVYLGVHAEPVVAASKPVWQTKAAIVAQEVQHA